MKNAGCLKRIYDWCGVRGWGGRGGQGQPVLRLLHAAAPNHLRQGVAPGVMRACSCPCGDAVVTQQRVNDPNQAAYQVSALKVEGPVGRGRAVCAWHYSKGDATVVVAVEAARTLNGVQDLLGSSSNASRVDGSQLCHNGVQLDLHARKGVELELHARKGVELELHGVELELHGGKGVELGLHGSHDRAQCKANGCSYSKGRGRGSHGGM
jgi:hypothetical protein